MMQKITMGDFGVCLVCDQMAVDEQVGGRCHESLMHLSRWTKNPRTNIRMTEK